MTLKTLELDLGTIQAQQYQTGWYQDPTTGQYYYYEASAEQWYVYAAGMLQPLSVPKEAAPKVVDIAAGDTLKIQYSYRYSGPAIEVTEYASIGYTTVGIYDEIVYKSRTRNLPQSATPTEYTGYLDLVMATPAQTKWNDIECKVKWGGPFDELGINYQNALNVVSVNPSFSDFAITDYSKA